MEKKEFDIMVESIKHSDLTEDNIMDKEQYAKCMDIMASLEGKWTRVNGLYQFNNPNEIDNEALEAAELLNDNYRKINGNWNKFIEMYGNEPIIDEFFKDNKLKRMLK